MSLLSIYDEYIKVNKAYVEFINEIVNNNFNGYSQEEIMTILVDGKNKFEELRSKTDKEEVLDEDDVNLKDLKYLVIDGLFLSIDLFNFYNCKEIERFKMRAINYIRKRRVADFF